MGRNGRSNGSGSQHLRACMRCWKRKIKCDKKNPCGNCANANIECVMPSSSRSARKPRKRPDDDVLERLIRLEGVISTLKSQKRECDETELSSQWRKVSDVRRTMPNPLLQGGGHHAQVASINEESTNAPPEHSFGRLVISEGKSRYINDCFWARIDREIEHLKDILMEPSDSEDDPPFSLMPQDTSPSQVFMFGFSSSNVDMATLHPPHQLIPRIWALFKTNVDPLVKILHVPTMETQILAAKGHLDDLPRGTEALMFAIYYSVVTSLTPTDCVAEFGETKVILSARYRFAVEQALSRASFLDSAEMMVLQAFVIFLAVLRRNDNARIVWTLTGLAVRIAQVIGVHRDGIYFGLVPFEVEMRRRIWWQVCLLDARASEDHGCDATIIMAQFDTQMPLNVNDADLNLDMTELPESRKGFTDMTICLLSFEFANIVRRILHVPPGSVQSNAFAASTDEQKEKWIIEWHQSMAETYLADLDLSVPPVWVADTLTRLILSKMWLMAYHPFQRLDVGAKLSRRIKDKLFLASVETIEYANQLNNDPRAQKWGWFFRTYFQWHSITFLLSELCNNTQGECVERAWRAIEILVQRRFGDAQTDPRRALFWRPLKKLMVNARMAREQALSAEQRLLIPGNADSVAGYPAIDMLLGWASTSDSTSEQFVLPTANSLTIHDTLLPPSQASLGVGSSEMDQDVLLNMGFGWSMTDICQILG
ncbi:hypothetical protein BKA56DRAFT_483320 [Ilyonectria sp. MPI-CAGE-AT-0026]|nr:hypothetical protein BKA56DRAFT_483320 [Ilyonectria sp. MPI-CAGE-AT-0026]